MAFKKGNKPWNTGTKGICKPWNKGKTGIYSEETLKKISEGRKGIVAGGANKGCTPWNKKRNYEGETSYKILNHHLRTSRRWGSWRTEVFQRDGFMCQDCGKKNIELHPHHIVSVKQSVEIKNFELIYDVDNGLTLCVPCHRLKHKKLKIGDD